MSGILCAGDVYFDRLDDAGQSTGIVYLFDAKKFAINYITKPIYQKPNDYFAKSPPFRRLNRESQRREDRRVQQLPIGQDEPRRRRAAWQKQKTYFSSCSISSGGIT